MLPTRILVATDGSPVADAAVTFAAEMAMAMSATDVLVVSVVRLLLSLGAQPDHAARHKEVAQQAADRVRAIVGDSVRIKTEAPEATSIVGEIIELAHKDGVCSHIVIGDRGHGEIGSVVLGSVSHHVIQGAHCPVTVIRL